MASQQPAVEQGPAAQPKAWTAWSFVYGVLQGVAVVGAFASFWSAFPDGLRGFLVLPALLLGAWLVVLVHEIGHAAAAALAGWGVAAFAAGPLGIHLVNRRFAFIPRSKRTEIEGFVVPLPASAAVYTRLRNALIDAGGPAISLVIGVVGVVIGLVFEGSPGSIDGAPAGLALGIGVLSLIVVAHTTVPIARSERSTDGQRVLRGLQMDDATWRRNRALRALHTLTKYQVRLRDLPPWMIEEAGREASAGAEGVQQYYDSIIIGMVLDSAPLDRTRARKLLDDFRTNYGASAWLDSCDAYFTAVWEGDAERARARLWHGDSEDELQPMLLAAEAAVDARSGNSQTARALLAQMRDAVRQRSIFPDDTFRDIGRQIEALLPA